MIKSFFIITLDKEKSRFLQEKKIVLRWLTLFTWASFFSHLQQKRNLIIEQEIQYLEERGEKSFNHTISSFEIQLRKQRRTTAAIFRRRSFTPERGGGEKDERPMVNQISPMRDAWTIEGASYLSSIKLNFSSHNLPRAKRSTQWESKYTF